MHKNLTFTLHSSSSSVWEFNSLESPDGGRIMMWWEMGVIITGQTRSRGCFTVSMNSLSPDACKLLTFSQHSETEER